MEIYTVKDQNEEKNRALAHIEKVNSIESIDGADAIEKITVLGWNLIAKKGEFNIGDKCVYIEIDSKVSDADARFAFLANKGFKVKTLKFNKFGVISQGLALPVTLFPELGEDLSIGRDVTEVLGIKKIETAEEIFLRKQGERKIVLKFRFKWFEKFVNKHPKIRQYFIRKKQEELKFKKQFPVWIKKTDETRCENIPEILNYKQPLIVTEKVDGTSSTYAIEFLNSKKTKWNFIICSRNNRMFLNEDSVYNTIAKQYNIENALVKIGRETNSKIVILQGETYGRDIQGNPYKIKGLEFRGFNLKLGNKEKNQYKVRRLNPIESISLFDSCKIDNIEWVPIIDIEYILPDTMEELKLQADGYSKINPNVKREGFVYRSATDETLSFKNVSREYLLKHNG